MTQPPRDWTDKKYRMGEFIRIVGDHMKAPDRDNWRAVGVVMRRLARDRRRWDAAHPAPRAVLTPAPENPGGSTGRP